MTQPINNVHELEKYLGFPITRVQINPDSKNPYDETISYGLCQRFYNKEDELQRAVIKTTNILMQLINKENDKKLIALYFSLLGNMYYILGDFKKSIGCFLKTLSYNKEDMTGWIELMFAIRANGDFGVFEDIIFNLEKIYIKWCNDKSEVLTKEKIFEIIKNS